MANQPQQLTLPTPRTYTRTDFTALRAFVQRVPAATIARLYYDVERSPHAASAETTERYLRQMRDDLVSLALKHGSSVLADHLKASIKQHGSARLTAMTLRMVEQASTLAAATPTLAHPVELWFRPLIARRLIGEGITTLGALIEYCNARGGSWWRSVPRIGPLRAATLVAWLRRHERSLGARVADDVDARPLDVTFRAAGEPLAIVVGGDPAVPRLAPFEQLAVPAELSGGHALHRGINRASSFAFIRAEHDLAAVHAYLHRYRDRPVTLRAYTRELERLILWSVVVRQKPLSSLLVEDCEAYKDFLKAPIATFTGPKRPRTSGRWRPFAPEGLSEDSQAYAVRVIRAAFAWLVEVRYLAGNPWSAVHEPATVVRESAVQVHRALPADLWTRVRRLLDERCTAPILPSPTEPGEARAHLSKQARARVEQEAAPQWRAAQAAILLMGDSGLRRVEAAQARREDLRPSDVRSEVSTSARQQSGEASGARARTVWTLTIVGKRRKQRTVPVSSATLDALRAHWADRDRNFDSQAHGPLIAPLWIPETNTAQNRHATDDDVAYTPDALGRLVRMAVRRLVVELRADPASLSEMSTEDLVQLVNTSAHAFRHTFGTRAVARDMPTDVVQSILGHASLQTTSIYVKAEKRRMVEAAARYYADDDA
ncbi:MULTISPECIES: site-specific integrase [unclassified Caballeronia]|uniref:site-specific integrase n=1 Tax=unclassified Caballeronia TaxID=2646786 RepID=UPI00285C78B7|nr:MULTISPECIES: site-specific integrase [unclassified Caballeronia]MDR5777721.1 site-specific integrase [Caballeronia sp. LZ002]MDR5853157.1 site-specific integrase [Caballeronia sp. LZ003]